MIYSQPHDLALRHSLSGYTRPQRLALIFLGAAYAIFAAAEWSLGYIDFGDGNYMYIGWRIAQGGAVYRDILAPQPPCHLFVGALLYKISQWTGAAEPVFVFRAFSLLLHLANGGLVVSLARRAWGRPWVAVVAGAIYLWLPIGFWWSMGYQSEPLEILFLLLMMRFALRATLGGDLWAGVFAALAALTNATAAPFLLVMIVFMLLRAPLRALRMTVPCIVLAAWVTWVMQGRTGGAYLQNVIFNQVGTFPGSTLGAILRNAFARILTQGGKVLSLEGAFIFVALLGLWRYLRESALAPMERSGLAWFMIATLGSIIYVSKGGTMDYIFSLSEPAVAILAAGELAAWARRWLGEPERGSGLALGWVPYLLPKLAALGLLAGFALGPAVAFYYSLWTQRAYELDEKQTLQVVRTLKELSGPDEEILAPPFYAFVAGRRIWGDYSELYIWTVNYLNDRNAERKGEPSLGAGVRKVEQLTDALNQGKLPLAVIEMDQTGRVPEVMKALQDHYVPLFGEPLVTVNTKLGFFVPAFQAETEQQAGQRAAKWWQFKDSLLKIYGFGGVDAVFASWFAAQPAGAPAPSPQAAP